MSDAQDDAASEAARELAAKRWGNQAVGSAQVVISRADELPDSLRAQLHQATEEAPDD